MSLYLHICTLVAVYVIRLWAFFVYKHRGQDRFMRRENQLPCFGVAYVPPLPISRKPGGEAHPVTTSRLAYACVYVCKFRCLRYLWIVCVSCMADPFFVSN